MIAWQPLAFVALLAILIILYEVWAVQTGKPYTITEGWRALSNRVPWIAILVLILAGFMLCHCFGHSLGVSE